MIEPAPDNYNLAIAVNGATATEAATVDYPVNQLKKILIDDQTYYLTCCPLDPGSDTEVNENVN